MFGSVQAWILENRATVFPRAHWTEICRNHNLALATFFLVHLLVGLMDLLALHLSGLFINFRYGHMIDNVVLIVTGTLHERDVHELLEKCHPLGMFDRYSYILSIWISTDITLFYLHFSPKVSDWSNSGLSLSIASLAVAQNMRDLYRLVLVDTPLAPYFSECITSEVPITCPMIFVKAFPWMILFNGSSWIIWLYPAYCLNI